MEIAMSTNHIPKRVLSAILQSLSAGVVPRIGLEHIAVGRKHEIEALLHDIDEVVAEGGASFRFILGRYGSGKSFLCQLIRNYALQRNFVVMDADLSPTRRLTGPQGQGLSLYRELLTNAATKTRQDGGAFSALLERWISDLQEQVVYEDGVQPHEPRFRMMVERRIRSTINQMEGMVHGFDFATVISEYWRGHITGEDARKSAALRWLRGEYSTKGEARQALGVRVIIDDSSWYDYIKLLAHFVTSIGYRGLILFIDEAVNLYKISHKASRNSNYERLLTLFNDTTQGKARYLGIIMGVTPQMVEDERRGLYSYEALRSRLEESRFVRDGLRDLTGPIIRLQPLTAEETFVLLQRIRELHAMFHRSDVGVSDQEIEYFIRELHQRLGADQLLTPREIVRDFLSILNIMVQNPGVEFMDVLGSDEFAPARLTADPEALVAEVADSGEDDAASRYKTFEL